MSTTEIAARACVTSKQVSAMTLQLTSRHLFLRIPREPGGRRAVVRVYPADPTIIEPRAAEQDAVLRRPHRTEAYHAIATTANPDMPLVASRLRVAPAQVRVVVRDLIAAGLVREHDAPSRAMLTAQSTAAPAAQAVQHGGRQSVTASPTRPQDRPAVVERLPAPTGGSEPTSGPAAPG